MATKTEIIQLLTLINKNYPSSKLEISEVVVDTWHALLGHYDVQTLKVATYKAFETCKFAPTISEIRDGLKDLIFQELPSEAEAWAQASKAATEVGTDYEYIGFRFTPERLMERKVFDKFDDAKVWCIADGCRLDDIMPVAIAYYPSPLVRRVLEAMGGTDVIRLADNKEVVRGQFGRLYRELRDRLINEKLMSPFIKSAAQELAGEVERRVSSIKALTGDGEEEV